MPAQRLYPHEPTADIRDALDYQIAAWVGHLGCGERFAKRIAEGWRAASGVPVDASCSATTDFWPRYARVCSVALVLPPSGTTQHPADIPTMPPVGYKHAVWADLPRSCAAMAFKPPSGHLFTWQWVLRMQCCSTDRWTAG